MTVAPRHTPPGSRLPILGPLSVIGRVAIVLTVVTSIVAIVLDFGLHANPTADGALLMFVYFILAVSFFEFVQARMRRCESADGAAAWVGRVR